MKILKKCDAYDLIIFDLDGTLVDSMWVWSDIDEVYLNERGHEFPSDLQKNIEGLSTSEVAKYFKKAFELEDSEEEMLKIWQDMAKRYYAEDIKPKLGVIDFLDRLKARGIKLAVGTSNFRSLAESVLKSNRMLHYFDAIMTSEEAGKGKPNPDLFLQISEKLGVEPSRCLVFEDAYAGVMAANNAGMDVYSIFDFSSRDFENEIRAASIDMIFDYNDFMYEFMDDGICKHFGICGGCSTMNLAYEDELDLKKTEVLAYAEKLGLKIEIDEVLASPIKKAHRNKMEYSFGDECAGGELNLGFHRKGRIFDVVSTPGCMKTHADFERVRAAVELFARESGEAKFHARRGTGLWRNLVLRRGYSTGEILLALSISKREGFDSEAFLNTMLELNFELEGEIVGIWLLVNDRRADVVERTDNDELLYGRDYYRDVINGMEFEISLFSFFQTNTPAAELLFKTAFNKLSLPEDKTVLDLFCGVGTIGRLISPISGRVIGVEIVEEAVEMARLGAEKAGLANCEFIAGDVFKVLGNLNFAEIAVPSVPEFKLDSALIILDPPRSGVSQKAIRKIAALNCPEILYISCNPKTMLINLVDLKEAGYTAGKITLVDLYPYTRHVECIALIQRVKS